MPQKVAEKPRRDIKKLFDRVLNSGMLRVVSDAGQGQRRVHFIDPTRIEVIDSTTSTAGFVRMMTGYAIPYCDESSEDVEARRYAHMVQSVSNVYLGEMSETMIATMVNLTAEAVLDKIRNNFKEWATGEMGEMVSAELTKMTRKHTAKAVP